MAEVDLKIRREVFERAGCRQILTASIRGIALLIFAAAATIGQQALSVPLAKKAIGRGTERETAD